MREPSPLLVVAGAVLVIGLLVGAAVMIARPQSRCVAGFPVAPGVHRVQDPGRGVTCYITQAGISCLPDSQLFGAR